MRDVSFRYPSAPVPQSRILDAVENGHAAEELAEVLGFPLLARMRADPSLALDLEVGLARAIGRRRPLTRAAVAVVNSLRAAS